MVFAPQSVDATANPSQRARRGVRYRKVSFVIRMTTKPRFGAGDIDLVNLGAVRRFQHIHDRAILRVHACGLDLVARKSFVVPNLFQRFSILAAVALPKAISSLRLSISKRVAMKPR